ncbi:MAG: hypothetical protein GC178_03135 [Flavobacteriales bacterium]|nr:hypothetical protein [Flavobacteriales bacterium]
METTSAKKVIVSYLMTSVILFFISALMSVSGLFGNHIVTSVHQISVELMIVTQLSIVLVSNAVFHWFFYYAGFNSSPITKGLSIGMTLGVAYFLVCVFGLNLYDISGDPLHELAGVVGGRVIEYCTGGVAAAVISVSDVEKWGLLRAF